MASNDKREKRSNRDERRKRTKPSPGSPEFVAEFERALHALEAAQTSGDVSRILRAMYALADASGGAIQISSPMRIA